MSAWGEMRKCPHCARVYRHCEGDADWCRVCPEGLRHQPPEVQSYVRYINDEFDRAEREYLEQP